MKKPNPIGASVQVCPTKSLHRSLESCRTFSVTTMIRLGFTFLLFFGSLNLAGLQAQELKSHEIAAVEVARVSPVSRPPSNHTLSAPSLIKRIALLPIRFARNLVSALFRGNEKPSMRREEFSARLDDTKRTLLRLESVKNDPEVLASLFRVGDDRIDDLIKALDDPDDLVSLRAQIVIRYLGNEEGMNRLVKWYGTRKEISVSGPVPLPLNKWDFDFVETYYTQPSSTLDGLMESYVYALSLDYAPAAKELLNKVAITAGANLREGTTVGRAIKLVQTNQPAKPFAGKKDLAELVLANAFFVSPSDSAYTSARVLAFNAGKDKALVEVHINRGTLAEEWYHVVISKSGEGWKFFSITQVAIS